MHCKPRTVHFWTVDSEWKKTKNNNTNNNNKNKKMVTYSLYLDGFSFVLKKKSLWDLINII